MDAADVILPPVPDTQNAASLYRKAARLLKEQSAPKNQHLLEYLAGLASSFMGDNSEPEKRAELDELMAPEVVISALATVEEALQRPECRFDHDYDNGLYADVLASTAVHPLMRRDTETFASRDLHHLACLWGARVCLEAEAGRVVGPGVFIGGRQSSRRPRGDVHDQPSGLTEVVAALPGQHQCH